MDFEYTSRAMANTVRKPDGWDGKYEILTVPNISVWYTERLKLGDDFKADNAFECGVMSCLGVIGEQMVEINFGGHKQFLGTAFDSRTRDIAILNEEGYLFAIALFDSSSLQFVSDYGSSWVKDFPRPTPGDFFMDMDADGGHLAILTTETDTAGRPAYSVRMLRYQVKL
jgi:hypothetical protein